MGDERTYDGVKQGCPNLATARVKTLGCVFRGMGTGIEQAAIPGDREGLQRPSYRCGLLPGAQYWVSCILHSSVEHQV